MLPGEHRLRASVDFARVMRTGRRVGRRLIVVHLARQTSPAGPVRVGLVVGKSVGGSVVRHQVSRRLRAQMAPRVAGVPGGYDVVIRALPAAATASSAEFARDLDHTLDRLLAKVNT
jgi:ribonuclease P protein component